MSWNQIARPYQIRFVGQIGEERCIVVASSFVEDRSVGIDLHVEELYGIDVAGYEFDFTDQQLEFFEGIALAKYAEVAHTDKMAGASRTNLAAPIEVHVFQAKQ